MNSTILLTSIIFCCALATGLFAADDLRVGTFNVRNSGANDGKKGWAHRRSFFVETVRRFDPDILGLQEVLPPQQKDLTTDLADYSSVSTFRDDGKSKGEAASIFYRKSRFDLLDSGTFWLSDTPETPGSFGWDAVCTRICTWAKLRDHTNGKTVLAANTHFDHVGVKARLNSATLIIDRLHAMAKDAAVILTGDFNSVETDTVYAALLNTAKSHGLPLVDTYRAAHPTTQPDEASFNGFKDDPHGLRIDWIFCSPDLAVDSSVIERRKSADGLYASDHWPVWATLHYASSAIK